MKGHKGLTDEFYGIKKSRKRSIFETDSYLKHSAFTAVHDRDAKFSTRFVKGVPLSKEGIQKGYLFREKWYING